MRKSKPSRRPSTSPPAFQTPFFPFGPMCRYSLFFLFSLTFLLAGGMEVYTCALFLLFFCATPHTPLLFYVSVYVSCLVFCARAACFGRYFGMEIGAIWDVVFFAVLLRKDGLFSPAMWHTPCLLGGWLRSLRRRGYMGCHSIPLLFVPLTRGGQLRGTAWPLQPTFSTMLLSLHVGPSFPWGGAAKQPGSCGCRNSRAAASGGN